MCTMVCWISKRVGGIKICTFIYWDIKIVFIFFMHLNNSPWKQSWERRTRREHTYPIRLIIISVHLYQRPFLTKHFAFLCFFLYAFSYLISLIFYKHNKKLTKKGFKVFSNYFYYFVNRNINLQFSFFNAFYRSVKNNSLTKIRPIKTFSFPFSISTLWIFMFRYMKSNRYWKIPNHYDSIKTEI